MESVDIPYCLIFRQIEVAVLLCMYLHAPSSLVGWCLELRALLTLLNLDMLTFHPHFRKILKTYLSIVAHIAVVALTKLANLYTRTDLDKKCQR